MLTIALPKGRIAKDTLDIFSKIFGETFAFESRLLQMRCGDFCFLLVRNQDIPTYVMHGAADLGVVGLDVLSEHESPVLRLLDLKIGQCKVCVGTVGGAPLDYTKPQIKIATKMPNITRKYFSQKAVATQVIKLYGSIELAPLVGLCDGITDIVETGETMRQNGLGVSEVVMQSSAFLIANKNSFVLKKSEILALYAKLSAHINC